MANKSSISNYEQKLYIDGIEALGVTSIDGGYEISEDPIYILGKGFTYGVKQGAIVGSFQVSKYYIGDEILLSYTGDKAMNGSINYEGKTFGFEDAYLSEYSLSCGIGQIPTASAQLQVYGDIGSGIDHFGNEPVPEIQIPNQGSIQINVDGFESNRVSDFSYTMRMNRTPVYAIGSPFPITVHQQFPVIQECSFTLEIFDYEINQLKSSLIKPISQDLSISLNNPISDLNINTFTLKDAKLTNQSLNSTSDTVMIANLTYSAYINKR